MTRTKRLCAAAAVAAVAAAAPLASPGTASADEVVVEPGPGLEYILERLVGEDPLRCKVPWFGASYDTSTIPPRFSVAWGTCVE